MTLSHLLVLCATLKITWMLATSLQMHLSTMTARHYLISFSMLTYIQVGLYHSRVICLWFIQHVLHMHFTKEDFPLSICGLKNSTNTSFSSLAGMFMYIIHRYIHYTCSRMEVVRVWFVVRCQLVNSMSDFPIKNNWSQIWKHGKYMNCSLEMCLASSGHRNKMCLQFYCNIILMF